MSETTNTPGLAASEAASFLGTFGLILVAIGGLFAIDMFLARMERAERGSEARRFFEEGVRSASQGRSLEAIDRFRSALSSDRQNGAYQRALGASLLAAGKLGDAEAVLTDRLQRDPTDAMASLAMARVLVRGAKPADAISYYHRAIFGDWDADPVGNRVRARFELVDLLAQRDLKRQLLAELLPLEDEAPTDIGTRRRIAHLFIRAGSPSRAVDIFRDILRNNADDADAYAGVGEAEFALGNYRTAQSNFLAASRLEPGDRRVAAQLALCNQVLALDPTQRGLGTGEQYRRSQALLELTLQAVEGCAGPSLEALRPTIDSARAAATRHAPPARQQDLVDSNLDLAERLWQARRTECPQPISAAEEPLALVLERADQ